jgi:peptidoglycan/LPS O-acetylase OafA/YrhL
VLFAGNSVSWTLSVELFFYLCLPVLLFVGSAGTVLIAAAITVLTLAWASVEGGMRADVIVLTSPGAFFVHFAVDMLLARLFVTRSWKIGKGPATALEIGAAGLALGYIFTNQQVAPVLAPLLHLDSYALSWIARTPAPIVFGALVLILAIGRGYLSDLLRQRPLVLLGEISFATYLVHMVLLRQMLRWSWLTLSPGLMIILYVILTYALSFLLYRFIEIPSNRWLRFKIDQLLPRQASAAA